MVSVPWSPPIFSEAKGVLNSHPTKPANEENRLALLTAIAKARRWLDDLVAGRVASFAELAKKENRIERHIRNLTNLAFVSPPIVKAIADHTGPDHLSVTAFNRDLALSWKLQEQSLRPGGDY